MQIDLGQKLHYFDNAATTFPKPESVLQLAVKFCATACVNPGRSTFDLAMEAESMLRNARQTLTTLFVTTPRTLSIWSSLGSCDEAATW